MKPTDGSHYGSNDPYYARIRDKAKPTYVSPVQIGDGSNALCVKCESRHGPCVGTAQDHKSRDTGWAIL